MTGSRPRGHWVFAGGLASPNTATVIDNRGGGGHGHRRALSGVQGVPRRLWIIEAPDLDVALKLATEGSKACNRKVEVRPFLAE
jgi:hypothetical protein